MGQNDSKPIKSSVKERLSPYRHAALRSGIHKTDHNAAIHNAFHRAPINTRHHASPPSTFLLPSSPS